MSAVGLFYVGAVLFVNGLLFLGLVDGRAAAPINLFVGGLQVLAPTVLIVMADGDSSAVLAASGLYLFGFTYLYVGIGLLIGLDSTGVGYFSLFVAIAATGFSWVNFAVFDDPAFGVIWLCWSFLWALYFVLLGLKRDRLTRYVGAVTVVEAWLTAAGPGFLLLVHGGLPPSAPWVLAVVGLLAFVGLTPLARTDTRAASSRVAAG